ncbi:NADH-quinone oxidoreductase subunit J family protein [Cephaloticoccus primus]|uniref:NADH-quinone oxidoreductase subunit J family protein n=1 Tax=Cephaloticoccus primus TaxID=1548207 RepID=UPI000838D467|nr:NADH-quinone oxidoreductase subunit J [Cephaloticoccus primus]
MLDTLFITFATFALLFALGAVLSPNAINAALCFLLCLVSVAGLFVLLEAYLLAVLLVLVYAGAVVALFLFIIMLLDLKEVSAWKLRGVSALASVAGAGLLVAGVLAVATRGQLDSLPLAAMPALGADLKAYAHALFTTYLLPVQLMGFLLLIAMLGVIVLSKKFTADAAGVAAGDGSAAQANLGAAASTLEEARK